MKLLTNLDMTKNQLQNALLHKLATAPASPVSGQAYYNTADNRAYVYNGSAWVAMDAVGATMTGANIVTAINGSASLIDNDNLSATANTAITNSHTHSNKAVLDATTASFLIADETKLDGLVSNATHTGDVTGATALTIANNVVTNAKLAQVATNIIKGRVTASTGNLEDLTPTQVKTMLAIGWADVSSKPSSTVANIDDAVTKRHSQNTDTGTTAASFQINSGVSGPRLKDVSGVLNIRNAADNAFADIRVNNLIVEGGTTTINSNEVNIGDSEILLNADITTNAENSSGGIGVKRLMADNTTRKDARFYYSNTLHRWMSVIGPVENAASTLRSAVQTASLLGDNVATDFLITHGLNNQFPTVTISEFAAPYSLVMADVEFTDAQSLTVRFATPPTENQYIISITG